MWRGGVVGAGCVAVLARRRVGRVVPPSSNGFLHRDFDLYCRRQRFRAPKELLIDSRRHVDDSQLGSPSRVMLLPAVPCTVSNDPKKKKE